MRESTLKRFLRLPKFEEHFRSCTVWIARRATATSTPMSSCAKLQEHPAEAIRPQPLVTGDDLIQMGYLPGSRFKEILHIVEDAQLERGINSREEALIFIKERFEP